MTAEQFERERIYSITLAISRAMHSKGILTADELAIIDTKLREIYKPLLAALYPTPLKPLKALDFSGFLSDIW